MTAGRANYFKAGDYNAICEVCGQKWKASQIRMRWDGLMVCPPDFEVRSPQEFASAEPDPIPPAWTRPVPASVFVDPGCSLESRSCIVGVGVVGCMVVGLFPSTD